MSGPYRESTPEFAGQRQRISTVSFMHSYPNLVPLSVQQVTAIASALEPFEFDRIYGIFFDLTIAAAAKQRLKASVERYVAAISGASS